MSLSTSEGEGNVWTGIEPRAHTLKNCKHEAVNLKEMYYYINDRGTGCVEK